MSVYPEQFVGITQIFPFNFSGLRGHELRNYIKNFRKDAPGRHLAGWHRFSHSRGAGLRSVPAVNAPIFYSHRMGPLPSLAERRFKISHAMVAMALRKCASAAPNNTVPITVMASRCGHTTSNPAPRNRMPWASMTK